MPDTKPVIALKVDVDTYAGTRDGVPRLLEIFARYGISATFYFSLGPDNSGKAIRRIFKKGFLRKMLRTKAPSAYGLKTLLYGVILPPPVIGEELPETMKAVEIAGHEVGIHCWDHVKWHDLLPWMPKQVALMELGRASAMFEDIFGRRARTTAAPGWTVSSDSLEIQDAMGLTYCSDSRGSRPFRPCVRGRCFSTLQIPTTWPTMDELIGENGITRDNINDHYLSLLKPGLNVHTIHAELEGNVVVEQFVGLLDRLQERKVRFITLGEAAVKFGADPPYCDLEMGYIEGRAMPVALQMGG